MESRRLDIIIEINSKGQRNPNVLSSESRSKIYFDFAESRKTKAPIE